MKKLISGILSAAMLAGCVINMTVSAFDGIYEITSDKTAQWTTQEKNSGYDLRIHGWKEWEAAAYMGFDLPDNFTSENLVSARLVLDTVSYNKAGTAYLYSADYGAYKESDDSIEHNKNISITLFDTDGYKLPAQNCFKDNGYIADTTAIAGKVSGINGGNSVTIKVNDVEYNVTPDRFGDYVLRIPYADTITVTANEAKNRYKVDMRKESVKRGIDFTVSGGVVPTSSPDATDIPNVTSTPEATSTSEPKEYLSDIVIDVDESGILSYSVSYKTEAKNPTLYVTLYDENGRLIGCKLNKQQGKFEVLTGGYEIKAFLWDDEMKPITEAKLKR